MINLWFFKIIMHLGTIEIDGQEYTMCGDIGIGAVGSVQSVISNGRKYAMKVINQYGRNPII